MPLTAQVAAALRAELTGANIGGAVPVYTKPSFTDIFLTDGVGSGQASKLWDSVRSILTASNDDIDLAGALLDPFGAAVVFATIKAIVIRSADANTTNLTVGNATNPFIGPFGAAAHTVQVRPGGALVMVAPQTGWAVVAGTGDILRVANAAGATANYSISVIGT